MIERLIHWSIANRFLVLLATLFLAAWGVWAVKTTPVDALPDLSDVQVIVTTLSYDLENDPDIVAMIAASAALVSLAACSLSEAGSLVLSSALSTS